MFYSTEIAQRSSSCTNTNNCRKYRISSLINAPESKQQLRYVSRVRANKKWSSIRNDSYYKGNSIESNVVPVLLAVKLNFCCLLFSYFLFILRSADSHGDSFVLLVVLNRKTILGPRKSNLIWLDRHKWRNFFIVPN